MSWFNTKGYLQGIFWILIVCIISNLNDVNTKYLGERLSGAEVAFFRFFFGTLVLLPFMILRGKQAFITRYPAAHAVRAILLVLAMTTWSYGVVSLPLTLATTISFTVPFFVLLLARLFLKENVSWQRWGATVLGFIGILISVSPHLTFNPWAATLILATFLFASLDVINKKLLTIDESLMCMLFYSDLGTTILGSVPAYLTWQTPHLHELFFLAMLGSGGVLILYCLLKAFAATEVSALQPFRYTEFLISVIFGFIIFQEWPSLHILLGAAIIISATLYLTLYET